MKVACCTLDIKVSNLRSPTTSFGSQEALVFLQNCNKFKRLKQIHGRIIRFGLTNDQLLVRKILQLSSYFGKMNYATLVFDQLNVPDIFTWNVMIRAYAMNGSPEKALLLFKTMLSKGLAPDKFTYPFVINACIASSGLYFGRVTHALAIKMGFWSDVYVQNTMMNLYFKGENVDEGRKVFDKMRVRNVFSWTTVIAGLAACGELEAAREIFDQMPCKNVVSWTAMIDGYVKHNHPIEAFGLFQRMQLDNVRPNEFTLVSLIKACAEMGSLQLGRFVRDFAIKNGFEIRPFLGTALIDMYSKCDSLDDAITVFDMMKEKNLATWNTMITSLGVHGFCNEALALFEEMEKTNVVPDNITFVGVLSACIQMNKMEGEKYFNLMIEHYGVTPILEHYTCMIKLYNHANELDDEKVIHDVAKLLQQSKLTSIDDIKKFIHWYYRDLDFSELELVHPSMSSPPQIKSF